MFLSNTESTMMSVLYGVAGQDDDVRRAYLERFCEAYTEPLVKFLVATKRVSDDDAMEVVQDFWLAKVIEPSPEQNLITKYLAARHSKENSSFRRYLSKSLTFHFINRFNSAGARRDRANVALDQLEGWEPEFDASEQVEFDAVWSNHLLDQVLAQVHSECQANGHAEKWSVFLELVLRPGMRGISPPSYAELASKLNIDSPKAVGNAWMTVKRMTQRNFVTAVQQYLPSLATDESLADAERETREILFGLAARGGLRIKLNESVGKVESSCESASIELSKFPAEKLYRNNADLRAAWESAVATKACTLFGEPVQHDGDPTLEEWLQSEKPSLCSLDRVRQISKKHGKQSEQELSDHHCFPLETWALIYLLVLAIAKLKLDKDLSQTKTPQLKTRMEPFLSAEWVDEQSRAVLARFTRIAESPH